MNNDLISREALKNIFLQDMCGDNLLPKHYVIAEIDNAPTVEQNWRFYYDHGYKQAERDLKRPQGEWILNKDENPECPFCNHSFTYWGNFCGNCGADMRGKEA